jgi:hypothetical protein
VTNLDVKNLLRVAHEKGRADVDDMDVRLFLAAKAILAADSEHQAAKDTVKNFLQWMETGVNPGSFAQFLLPRDCFETVEEKLEGARLRDEHLAWRAKQHV